MGLAQLPYVLIGAVLAAAIVGAIVLTVVIGASGLLLLLVVPLVIAYVLIDRRVLKREEESGEVDPGSRRGA